MWTSKDKDFIFILLHIVGDISPKTDLHVSNIKSNSFITTDKNVSEFGIPLQKPTDVMFHQKKKFICASMYNKISPPPFLWYKKWNK
jgi:hypothetical protein